MNTFQKIRTNQKHSKLEAVAFEQEKRQLRKTDQNKRFNRQVKYMDFSVEENVNE